jgi:hypothetical protein
MSFKRDAGFWGVWLARGGADHAQNGVFPVPGKFDAAFFNDRRVLAFIAKQGVDHIARAFWRAPAQGVQQNRAGNGGYADAIGVNRVGFIPSA